MSTEDTLKLALEALKDNQHLVADNERRAYVMEYNSIIEKLEEALAKQEQGEPYGYVDAKGGGLFIYGEHQFQNTKGAELAPVYLHPKQEQGESWNKGIPPMLPQQKEGEAFVVSYEPKQEQGEPVAWMTIDSNGEEYDIWYENPEGKLIEGWTYKALYTTPQPKQEQGEPVAIKHRHEWFRTGEMKAGQMRCISCGTWGQEDMPKQRTWVGLDPEEIRKTKHHMVDGAYHYSFKQGAEWAEAKLKEKNSALKIKPMTDEEYSIMAEEYTSADGLDCVDFGRAISRHYGIKENT
jgi:hypothetical protein